MRASILLLLMVACAPATDAPVTDAPVAAAPEPTVAPPLPDPASGEAASSRTETSTGTSTETSTGPSSAWAAADDAWIAWHRGGQAPEAWASLLESAVRDADGTRAARALDELGGRLAVWRGDGLHPAVARAVQRLAAAEATATRLRIDPRRLVPALEVLIDVGDAAALHRVTGERSGREAPEAWAAARRVAEARGVFTGRVAFTGGCSLTWDGEPRAEAAFDAMVGTHTAACAGTTAIVVPVHHERTLQLDVVDGVLVWVDPTEDP